MTTIEDICLRLEDILEQTGYVLDLVSKISMDEFLVSPIYSAAIARYFEIIGEASKYVPDDIREQYPKIPWRQLAGFRDVLIHNYPRIDLELVWHFAVYKTPELHQQIEEILWDLNEQDVNE